MAERSGRTARPDVEYKFQGQEAPIVIYSMTTSTHADAPRGMNFLSSLNRLNFAMSRARALSVLVCSPALFEPECRTPEQMRMANAFHFGGYAAEPFRGVWDGAKCNSRYV
jgi:AAA domain